MAECLIRRLIIIYNLIETCIKVKIALLYSIYIFIILPDFNRPRNQPKIPFETNLITEIVTYRCLDYLVKPHLYFYLLSLKNYLTQKLDLLLLKLFDYELLKLLNFLCQLLYCLFQIV